MPELTSTATAATLIPGSPDSLDELAARLETFARGFGSAAEKLDLIKAGEWRGDAGDAFRTLVDGQPRTFRRAGTSFSAAGRIVRWYSGELRAAQADALRASSKLAGADRDTSRWQAQSAATTATSPASPPVGSDPGLPGRESAHRRYALARQRVELAATHTRRVLAGAAGDAPKKPGYLHRAAAAIGHAMSEVGKGFLPACKEFLRSNARLTVNLFTHPIQFAKDWWALGQATLNPLADLRRFYDWNDLRHHRFRFVGHMMATFVVPLGASAAMIAPSLGASRRTDGGRSAVAEENTPPPPGADRAGEANPLRVGRVSFYRGLSDDARWSQRDFTPKFSTPDDPAASRFSGMPLSEVVSGLRSGRYTTSELPVGVVRLDGHLLIDNTRSSQALMMAGIPRSQWIVRDLSAVPSSVRKIKKRLKRNNLDTGGCWDPTPSTPRQTAPVPTPSTPTATPSGFDWGLLRPGRFRILGGSGAAAVPV